MYLGISFYGSSAKFINLERQGHKLFSLFLEPQHLDQIFSHKFKDIHLELLQVTPERRTMLSKALRDGSADFAFTSNDVKNGGMLMVTIVYTVITMFVKQACLMWSQ